MLSQLHAAEKVVGVKQSQKAVREGLANTVFIAKDAENRVIRPIEALCNENNVPIVMVDSMQQLGQAVGIDVGAAVAVMLK